MTTLDRLVAWGREQETTVWAHAHAGDRPRVALKCWHARGGRHLPHLDSLIVRRREQEPTVWAHAHAGDSIRVVRPRRAPVPPQWATKLSISERSTCAVWSAMKLLPPLGAGKLGKQVHSSVAIDDVGGGPAGNPSDLALRQIWSKFLWKGNPQQKQIRRICSFFFS